VQWVLGCSTGIQPPGCALLLLLPDLIKSRRLAWCVVHRFMNTLKFDLNCPELIKMKRISESFDRVGGDRRSLSPRETHLESRPRSLRPTW
jgi:hypothetical protein